MNLETLSDSEKTKEYFSTDENFFNEIKKNNYVGFKNQELLLPIGDRNDSPDEEDLIRIHNKRIGSNDDQESIGQEEDLSKFQMTPPRGGMKPFVGSKGVKRSLSREIFRRSERRFATHLSQQRSEDDSGTEVQSITNFSDKQGDFSFIKKSTNCDSLDLPSSKVKSIHYRSENRVHPLTTFSNSNPPNEEIEKNLLMIKEESPPGIAWPIKKRDSIINIIKVEETKSNLLTRLNSMTRKRRASVAFESEEDLLKRKKVVTKMLNTFSKVVRAISILRNRAGLTNLSSANENQVRMINDLSWFQNTVQGHQRKVNPQTALGEKLITAGKRTVNFFIQKLHLGLIYFIAPLVEKIKNRIHVIYPKQKSKILWDLFIMGLIFWKFITISISLGFGIPLSMAFVASEVDSEERSNGYTIFLSFCFVLLVIDILLTLNTSYYESGEQVISRRKIMKKYFKSNFILDAAALVPLFIQLIFIYEDSRGYNSGNTKFILLLFFLKYYNLRKVFGTLEELFTFTEGAEAIFSLFKLTVKIILIAHVMACIWHSLAYFSGLETTWLTKADILTSSWRKRYLYSIYWSLTTMTTVGYGDVTAQNEVEMAFNIFTMLVGSALFGYSINSIGFLLDKMNMKENQLKYDLRILNRYMKRKDIDYDLQVRVKKYMEFIWNEEKSENIQKEEEILQKLSSNLRDEVLLQSNGRVLNACKVLSQNFSQNTIKLLTNCIKQIRFSPEEIIFNEGEFDEDQNLFIVNKGEVQLSVDSDRREEHPTVIKTLSDGAVFGEISFFVEEPLRFTARSVSFSTIYIISKSDFLRIIRCNEDDYETFCMIRDEIIVYKNYKSLFQKCYSCDYSSHAIDMCPRLRKLPNKDFIISRYKARKDRIMKKILQRRRPNKRHWRRISYNALKDLQLIQDGVEKIQSEIIEDDDNDEEEGSTHEKVQPLIDGDNAFMRRPSLLVNGANQMNIHILKINSEKEKVEQGSFNKEVSKERRGSSQTAISESDSEESNSESNIKFQKKKVDNDTSIDIDTAIQKNFRRSSMRSMTNLTLISEKNNLLKPPELMMASSKSLDDEKKEINKKKSNALLARRNSFMSNHEIAVLRIPSEKELFMYRNQDFTTSKFKSKGESELPKILSPRLHPANGNVHPSPVKDLAQSKLEQQKIIELVSPSKIGGWKSKMNNRVNSPTINKAKNFKFQTTSLNQKRPTQERILKTKGAKPVPGRESSTPEKYPTLNANIGDQSPTVPMTKKYCDEQNKAEKINEKNIPFTKEELLDQMDTYKNYFKYFKHNNPDSILQKINLKISVSEKARLARISPMKKNKTFSMSPRRSFQLNRSIDSSSFSRKSQGSKKNLLNPAASNFEKD